MIRYRLRHLDVDDKVCEQVDLALVEQVYPKEVIQRCIQQSSSWSQKRRRVRQSTALSLVWLLIAMALWSRLNQRLVWQKLVGKLSVLHPAEGQGKLSDSAVSGDGSAQEPAHGLLWSLSHHGGGRNRVQHARYACQ